MAQELHRQHFDEKRINVPSPESVNRFVMGAVDGIVVCTVNGHAVRAGVDIDFVWGGNPGRHAYVPIGEIWIEEELELDDITGTIVHELVEERAMRVDDLSYEQAHKLANDWENVARTYAPLIDGAAVKFAERIVAGKLGKPKLRKIWWNE